MVLSEELMILTLNSTVNDTVGLVSLAAEHFRFYPFMFFFTNKF